MAATDSLQWEQSKQVSGNLVINLAGSATTYNGSASKSIYLGVSDKLEMTNNGNGSYTLGHTSDCITTSGLIGPTSNVTLSPGSSVKIPCISIDNGHCTHLVQYRATISSNILDIGDIATSLSECTTNSKVPGARVFRDSIVKVLMVPNSSAPGGVEYSGVIGKEITTGTWNNDDYVEYAIPRTGLYFVKVTAADNKGTSMNITDGRLALMLYESGGTGPLHAYSPIQSSGGNLLISEACTVRYYNKGDVLRSQVWTVVAGAKFNISIYVCPIQFYN